MIVRAYVTVLVIAAVLHGGANIAAQQSENGEVSWDIAVEDAEYLGSPARTYRAYSETEQLQLRLSVMNLSEAAVTIDQSLLPTMLEVRLGETGRETPVTVEWLPEVHQRGDVVPQVHIGPVYLGPQTGAGWRVVVRRQDGEKFVAGEYVITFWMHQLRSAVRTTDDRGWMGRVFDGPGKVALVVQPPTTPADRAKMHNMRARDAAMRREFLDALNAYSLASAAEPSNGEAIVGAANVYMILGRYREAIARVEEIMPRVSRDGLSPTRLTLARAYMAIRDEANALRVLRGSGLSEEKIASKLSELRQVR
jgi:hypothetical protein